MRRPVLFLGLLAAVGCSSGGVDPVPEGGREPSGQSAPPATKVFSYNAAPICSYETPDFHFDAKIVNDTGRTLSFHAVHQSCTCQNAELASAVVEPDKLVEVRMTTDVRHRSGPQTFVCWLHEERGEVWQLEVKTVVYDRARFEPSSALMFGKIDPNSRQSVKVNYRVFGRQRSELPSSVTFEFGKGSNAVVSLDQGQETTETLDSGIVVRNFPLIVGLNATGQPGVGQTSIRASFGEGGAHHESKVDVGWEVRSVFCVTPPQVFWGSVAADAAPEKSVTIERRDSKPFAITKVSGLPKGITCQSGDLALPSPKKVLTFRFAPAEAESQPLGVVLLQTDDPLMPEIRITVAASRRTDR